MAEPTATTPPRPIADHGAIGNMATMALVALDGAIDFLCWPDFDSPSIFAALLDPDKGGHFTVAPEIADARVVQTYLPDTNVLLTQWLGDEASVHVTDLMSGPEELGHGPARLLRRIHVTSGEARIRVDCQPRFDYARQRPEAEVGQDQVVFSAPGAPRLRLSAPVTFVAADGGATACIVLREGDVLDFVLDEDGDAALDASGRNALLKEVIHHWQAWSRRSTYRGRWREAVMRSALVLKLMTSCRHGAIVAAATFGLPEVLGGSRNWDYRATWIRDASFTVYALMRLGYIDEAKAFTRWTAELPRHDPVDGHLRIMYALDGGQIGEEIELDHLAGYAASKPVRIGNAAASQLQLDIFGALLDSIYLSNKYGEAISHADWVGVCQVVNFVCDNWQRPDAGIWEGREPEREHLHSQLMCWVAVDRALRLAGKRSLRAPFDRWIAARNEMSRYIWETFWNDELGHFVRSKGSRNVDGAMLMMPLVRFIGSTDPQWLATLDAIGEQLSHDALVQRYDRDDGLEGEEGAFAACSFWYVECLARAGRIDHARNNMEKLIAYGNHVDLYAEEFTNKAELLGNFPQAFTHLALISAATYLDAALDGKLEHPWQL
ncbi:glycoside hydrolase family 15 protein [Telluria beijingensis]|uniref:glycoside hydrolase family 15 protein n=1 Tax=Telluria beijingensis TaxID=3068633 RepID=UPI00279573C4|nr:glycoside hydrolase family 15 protein [Massilia sp. REN29]